MPREAALCIGGVFIAWLFLRDRKLRPMASWALWIPLLWVVIVGSRGSNYWLSLEVDPDLATAAFLEGSPVDRAIYLFLIISGWLVLLRRRPKWGNIVGSNLWLFVFFLYCGVSILWSRYPFVSFKGWIKDLGNIVMILIMITESNPVLAVKAVFSRYIYFAVPLSLVMIKYFPELSSYYVEVSGEIAYCGVTTNKNEFGEILVVSGLFLVHDMIERRSAGGWKSGRSDLLVRSALLVAVVWLLTMANSSTAVACLALGTAIMILVQFPLFKDQVRHIGVYTLGLVMLIVFLNSFSVLAQFFVKLLGRDMTFTGRTYIWTSLLKEHVNPILGTGFHSFWLPPGVMERYGYINQAHNGYIETYLNGGLIGACLLVAMIVAVGAKVKRGLFQSDDFGVLFLSIVVVCVFYNVTEAMFNRLSLIWFFFLLASFDYHLLGSSEPEDVTLPVKPGPSTPHRLFRGV